MVTMKAMPKIVMHVHTNVLLVIPHQPTVSLVLKTELMNHLVTVQMELITLTTLLNVKHVHLNAQHVSHHLITVSFVLMIESTHQFVKSHHQKPAQPKLTQSQLDLLKSSIVTTNVQLVKKKVIIVSLVEPTELTHQIVIVTMDTT